MSVTRLGIPAPMCMVPLSSMVLATGIQVGMVIIITHARQPGGFMYVGTRGQVGGLDLVTGMDRFVLPSV